MNERIEQLMNQSTEDILGVKIVDHKKFAELIVKVCIDKIETYRIQIGRAHV